MNPSVKIFVTLSSAVFAATTGVGMVAPLLPVYAYDLGAGAFQISLIFGAFSVTRVLFVPYFGKLSDRKGKRPFITTGLLIYSVMAILYTLSQDVWTLILLRLGQGFASAMIFPVAQAYVGAITPAFKEGQRMGLFNSAFYAGLSIGPLLGGLLKDWAGIQASFLAMGTLSFVAFLLCLRFLPPEPRSSSASGREVVPAKAPSLLKIMRNPGVSALFLFRTCFTLCIGITWTFLPLLAHQRLGLSSSAIGLVVMVNVLAAAIFQAPMGYVADRFGKRGLVVAGGLVAIPSLLYLNWAGSMTGLLLANGLFGLAGGTSFAAIMALGVIEGRQRKAMGSVMGLLAMAHSLGMLLGPLLGGILMDFYTPETPFVFGAVILAVGIVCFLVGT